MRISLKRFAITCAGMGYALLALVAADAQDVEIFVGDSRSVNSAKPNILLILDDSGSMGAEVLTQNNYDPDFTYDGGTCNADP